MNASGKNMDAILLLAKKIKKTYKTVPTLTPQKLTKAANSAWWTVPMLRTVQENNILAAYDTYTDDLAVAKKKAKKEGELEVYNRTQTYKDVEAEGKRLNRLKFFPANQAEVVGNAKKNIETATAYAAVALEEAIETVENSLSMYTNLGAAAESGGLNSASIAVMVISVVSVIVVAGVLYKRHQKKSTALTYNYSS
jgi:hypothetical protein